MISRSKTIVALLPVVLAVAACATAAQAGHSQSAQVTVPANAPTTTSTSSDTTPHTYTAADINFMGGMIGHHAQAIVMSQWAPTHGASPYIRTLALRIINAQQDEISSMRRWLTDRNQPVPATGAHGMVMKMNGMEHEMLMPGMLTEAQMKQLDEARGKEFDRLFLTFMIQHHRGAVTMVQELFDTNGAAQDVTVYKIASDIHADQTTEIDRMQKMLASAIFGRDIQ